MPAAGSKVKSQRGGSGSVPPIASAPSVYAASGTSSSSSKPSNKRKRKMDPNAPRYYAVRTGKIPGVYQTWAECQFQTAGFKGAVYKSFPTPAEAQAFVEGKSPQGAADITDPKDQRFYAVAIGRTPGIYTNWEEASVAIKGWKGPKYKRFDTRAEAIEFIRANGNEEGQRSIAKEAGSDGQPPTKKAKTEAVGNVFVDGFKQLAMEDSKQGIQHIYTDGSALSNGRAGAVAGVGVYFGPNDKRNVAERLQGEVQTNQRAELTAIQRALEAVPKTQSVRIFSDSKYSIQCVTEWYRNWEKNGWRSTAGSDVKNVDIIIVIRKLIVERDAKKTKTLFQWVKGHAETQGNIAADGLAVAGAKGRQ